MAGYWIYFLFSFLGILCWKKSNIVILEWEEITMMMFYALLPLLTLSFQKCDRRGSDRMVVRFTSIWLCNKCLSPLKMWVRIPLMVRCARYNIIINWPPRYYWNIVESGVLIGFPIFHFFDFKRTSWWRLFQKRVVRTKLDIYAFIKRNSHNPRIVRADTLHFSFINLLGISLPHPNNDHMRYCHHLVSVAPVC
jgi:hypothetical protein